MSDPDFVIPEPEKEHLERLKAIFARWLENPLVTATMMRDYITTQFHVGKVQAYNDIAMVKACFGNARAADKEFQRHRANHLLEQAATAAMAGDDKQAKALTKIAEMVVKANRLDEPEGEQYQWEEIVPKDESFSVDPAVIGIAKVPGIEEKARKLLARYNAEVDADAEMEVGDGI